MQHAINWFDIPVTDMGRAMKFYEAATGSKLRREAMGAPGEEMAFFELDSQEAVGGSLVGGPHAKPSELGTTVYLNAAPSIDAWIKRAETAGAKVLTPKTELPPGMGYMAHILDTEGNRVGLHAMA
jgi:uncharacterized protein